MLRAVRDWLAARFGGSGDGDEDADDARFVPSPLDASVRYAHGGGTPEGERELAEVGEQARELADQQRRD